MHDRSYRPRAREQALLIEPLGDELLVFDSERDRAHSLNQTAAKVWRACDGERDIYALQVECALDEDTLQLALDQLRTSRLLDEPEAPDAISRRGMLRRSLIAGTAAGFAVPVIRSITAPTPAMASSAKLGVKAPCTNTSSCSGSLVCAVDVGVNGSAPVCCGESGHACTSNLQCCDHLVCGGIQPGRYTSSTTTSCVTAG